MQNTLLQLSSSLQARLIFQEISFSAQQIVNRVVEIANELSKMQFDGRPLAFCMPNSPELLCWHVACFYKGIPIVPIIYEQPANVVQNVLQLTEPSYLCTTTEKQQELTQPGFSLKSKIKIIDDTHQALLIAPQLVKKIKPSIIKQEKLAMIIFSSGTTGVLKGIMHSYQSAYGFLDGLVEVLAVTEGLTYVVAQPMGHIGGIVTTILTLLHNGTAILLQKFDINEYMETLARYQPTHINLHTPLFYNIINYPNLDKNTFRNIVTSFAGGDNIPNDLPTKFTKKTGAPMQIGYGATETGIVIVNRDPYDTHQGSVGKKVISTLTEIELRDEQGKIVSFMEPGEIWVKSPACCLGYLHMEELNKKTIVDGWFRTGDLAYQDSDGYYWYKGRASQTINRGSHIIYPEYIEQVLFNHPAVKVAAVISAINKIEGEVPIAFIELKDKVDNKLAHKQEIKAANKREDDSSKKNIQDSIMQYAASNLEAWQLPAKIIILPKMPLNLTGKIDRDALKHYLIDSKL